MYDRIRNNRKLGIFVVLTRYLIGFAFIPSGLTKFEAKRFTQISTDTQIGYFFEGLYQTGVYWQFLGAVQLLASLLIMTQRLSALGSLIFLGIMSNIWVITLSMNFTGTPIITSLMLLTNLMLVFWDWDRIKYLFIRDEELMKPMIYRTKQDPIWETAGWVLYIFCLSAFVFSYYFKSSYMGTMAGIFIFAVVVLIISLIVSEKRHQNNLKKH